MGLLQLPRAAAWNISLLAVVVAAAAAGRAVAAALVDI
jgi:hypothetical protein